MTRPFLPVRPGTPEYAEATRGKITASIAADILCPGEEGVYGNPLTAWMRITGRDTDGIEDNEALEWGRESEDVHARLLARKAGVSVAAQAPGLIFDPDLPWLGASPDLILFNEDGTQGVGELKAPSDWKVKHWLEHGVPMGYAVQLSVQMRCVRVPWGIASALVPPAPVWQLVHHSPDMETWILEGLTAFWEDHVKTDVPPDPDRAWINERTLASIKKLHVPEPGLAMAVDETSPLLQVALDFERAKAEIKEAEQRKAQAEAALIQGMQGCELLYLPDGSGYSRKKQVTNYKPQPARTVESTVLRYHRQMK